MATRHLHSKTLKTDNVVQRLINSLYTDCGPTSLAILPEYAELPDLSPVDKALISVFRRLNSTFIEYKSKYKTNPVIDNYDNSIQRGAAKRPRRDYEGKAADGLKLLLDLMPLTGQATSIADRRGAVSPRNRIVRQRLQTNRSSTGYSNDTRSISRNVDTERDQEEMVANGDSANDTDFPTQIAKRFILFGGLSIVVSILLLGTKHKPRFDNNHFDNNFKDLIVKDSRTKRLCFDVLFRLCCLNPETAVLLNDHDDLLAFSFHCLASNSLKDVSCKLIEILLMEKPQTFSLCSVPMLKEVLCALDKKKLSSLCRILSIAMSDLDTLEQNKNLLAQNKQKRSSLESIPIREVNQELVMSVPGLLENILDIAVSKNYFPRHANSPTEIDNWMRFIDDCISNDLGSELSNVRNNQSFAPTAIGFERPGQQDSNVMFSITGQSLTLPIEPQSNSHLSGTHHFHNAGISMAEHLLTRVEALYVLSLLLIGKHRKQMQKELAEFGLIPRLSELMDSFVWKNSSGRSRTWNLVGHFSGCECSPEVAVKIQFLRLLHSYCDQNPYKHLLLTPCELDELQRIKSPDLPRNSFHENPENVLDSFIPHNHTSHSSDLPNPIQSTSTDSATVRSTTSNKTDSAVTQPIPSISVHLMCGGTHGLLSKIIEVLKKEPTQSTFRFWLCRAIESFLRGRISYSDQIFLLRRGLLQHVTASIINTEHRTIQHEIIQSSFDLLGEMVKFNIDACQQLDAILNTEAKLKKTMILINDNLIDSNMFIR